MQNQITQPNVTASPTSNTGTIVSVRGSVVDAQFPQRLPSYLNRAGQDVQYKPEIL